MKKSFYQRTWFKNMIVIGIPAIISIVGVVLSIIRDSRIKTVFIIFSLFSFLALIAFMVYYSKQDDIIDDKMKEIEQDNHDMKIIIDHLERQNNSNIHTINTISSFAELWAKNINAFANDVKNTGTALEKYWDKIFLYNSVCEKCRDAIEAYVGIVDHTRISVGFIEYSMNTDKEEWVAFVAHSNPESTRPRAFDRKEELDKSKEIASNNEEILRIFNRVSTETDLSKYTQYIAIPVFCSKKKMLGVFQIVTKYNYILKLPTPFGVMNFEKSIL